MIRNPHYPRNNYNDAVNLFVRLQPSGSKLCLDSGGGTRFLHATYDTRTTHYVVILLGTFTVLVESFLPLTAINSCQEKILVPVGSTSMVVWCTSYCSWHDN